MAAKGCDEFRTIRNPAIGELGCDLFYVEGDAAVLYLPTAVAFGEDCITGAGIAVLRKAGGGDVDEQLSAPHAHVRDVKVAEGNRRRTVLSDQAFQHLVRGIGPEMLVVGLRIGVHDQELILVVAHAQRERQLVEPAPPSLPDLAPRPRYLGRFRGRQFRAVLGNVSVRIPPNAGGADLLEALKYLLRLGTVEAKIAGRDDSVRAALRLQVGQAGIEPKEIAVDVGEDGDSHEAPLVAPERHHQHRRRQTDFGELVKIDCFHRDAGATHRPDRAAEAQIGDDVTLVEHENAGTLSFAGFQRDGSKAGKRIDVELLRLDDERIAGKRARDGLERAHAGGEPNLDDAITVRARQGRKPVASEIVSARAGADERRLAGQQHVRAVEQPRCGDMAGQRHVERCKMSLDAVGLGPASERREPHQRRAVLEDDSRVGNARFVGIVAGGLDRGGLYAEILERRAQDLMLLARPLVDRPRLADQRRRALDRRRRPYEQSGAEPARRGRDQPRPESDRLTRVRRHRAWYGSGEGASVKKSLISLVRRSFNVSGGRPKISSSVFSTLAMLRCAPPT